MSNPNERCMLLTGLDDISDAKSDICIQRSRLQDECILGYIRREVSILWGLFPWIGLCNVLASGTWFLSFIIIIVSRKPRLRLQVSWIGNAPMPIAHITKIEDARTGQWLRHLDHVTDPVRRIDMGWTMGDWNQLDVGIETVGLRGFFFLTSSLFPYSSAFLSLSLFFWMVHCACMIFLGVHMTVF
jgi:hypothetical protein